MTVIEQLHVSTVDVKPVNIDWSLDNIDDYRPWWDTIQYEDGDTDWCLVASNGSIEAVVVDGVPYKTYDEYADDMRDTFSEDEDEEGEYLAEFEFDALMRVEPYQWGGEGPMMNYWYPIEETVGEWSSFDPIAAAIKLKDLPLCLVEVDDKYGIALTGGGMDLSWEICDAYIALDKLPPIHFTLPRMAEQWRDRHQRVYEAMKRSWEVMIARAEDRLRELERTRHWFEQYNRE